MISFTVFVAFEMFCVVTSVWILAFLWLGQLAPDGPRAPGAEGWTLP